MPNCHFGPSGTNSETLYLDIKRLSDLKQSCSNSPRFLLGNLGDIKTSYVHGNTICLCPLQVDNIFAFIRQVAMLFWQQMGITISSYLFARWHLFWHVGYLRHQQQVDLLTLKVVSESRVTCATSVPILVFLASLFSS